jgi:hypothetical protein
VRYGDSLFHDRRSAAIQCVRPNNIIFPSSRDTRDDICDDEQRLIAAFSSHSPTITDTLSRRPISDFGIGGLVKRTVWSSSNHDPLPVQYSIRFQDSRLPNLVNLPSNASDLNHHTNPVAVLPRTATVSLHAGSRKHPALANRRRNPAIARYHNCPDPGTSVLPHGTRFFPTIIWFRCNFSPPSSLSETNWSSSPQDGTAFTVVFAIDLAMPVFDWPSVAEDRPRRLARDSIPL